MGLVWALKYKSIGERMPNIYTSKGGSIRLPMGKARRDSDVSKASDASRNVKMGRDALMWDFLLYVVAVGNTAVSGNDDAEIPDGNAVNFANRGDYCPLKCCGPKRMGSRKWRRPNRGGASCVIDAGFNGGPLCSSNWLI